MKTLLATVLILPLFTSAAVAAGLADRARLFVAGSSAGGQLAAWIVGSTDRFKAGAVVKPVINEISDALHTDQFANLMTRSACCHGTIQWPASVALHSRSSATSQRQR